MAEGGDLRHAGDRIGHLLGEIRSMAGPPVWERVDELVRLIVQLYGAGLEHIVEAVEAPEASVHTIRARLIKDELVASLLLLHGLSPDDLEVRVHKALEHVRPYLGSHGGDVEIVSTDAEQGIVRLRMKGSCDGCPSSLLTVKLAVEGAIKEAAPEVVRIEVEGVTESTKNHTARSTTTRPTTWVPLPALRAIRAGELAATEVSGARIVLCRIEGQLYAYRDHCPACGSKMNTGGLDSDVLACPSCGHRYDVRLAGRSLASQELHLDPFPLLENADGVRVAVS